jgi:60 kDa SS-A/Ro ribonucleoprotein
LVASVANIEGYGADTKLVIAADVSGSMQKAISAKSKVQNFDVGLMLAMLLQSRCKNVITGMFGDTWKTIGVPKTNILASIQEFHRREGEVGYSTNGYLVIRDLVDRKVKADKIMIFTDCQLWDSNNGGGNLADCWRQYKRIAPNAKLYLFDLAGYGNTTLSVMRDDVFLVAGWSDKVFNILEAIEKGSDAMEMINSIEL